MTGSVHCWTKRVLSTSARAASCALLCVVSLAQAALYEYRDASGRRVFVDRLSAVPLEYRDQLKERRETQMSDAQRAEAQRLNELARLQTEQRRVEALLQRAVTPVRVEGNRVLVPVRVSRGPRTAQLDLLLDTGANLTVLHRQDVEALAVEPRIIGQAETASGEQVALYAARLDRLEIGPYAIAPVQAQLIEFRGRANHQGLIGMDLLSQVKYELDLDNRLLRWSPEKIAELEALSVQLDAQIAQLTAAPDAQPEQTPSDREAGDRAE